MQWGGSVWLYLSGVTGTVRTDVLYAWLYSWLEGQTPGQTNKRVPGATVVAGKASMGGHKMHGMDDKHIKPVGFYHQSLIPCLWKLIVDIDVWWKLLLKYGKFCLWRQPEKENDE